MPGDPGVELGVAGVGGLAVGDRLAHQDHADRPHQENVGIGRRLEVAAVHRGECRADVRLEVLLELRRELVAEGDQHRPDRLRGELDGVGVVDLGVPDLPGDHAEVFALFVHVLLGEGEVDQLLGFAGVLPQQDLGQGGIGQVANRRRRAWPGKLFIHVGDGFCNSLAQFC